MRRLIPLLLLMMLLTACTAKPVKTEEPALMNITPQEAKTLMDTRSGFVILDVRTPEEYAESHIPGAILIPDYDIGTKAPEVLKDKNQMILVYCRSGRRSKLAAAELETMGYTCIREFGGILDWPYETEK